MHDHYIAIHSLRLLKKTIITNPNSLGWKAVLYWTDTTRYVIINVSVYEEMVHQEISISIFTKAIHCWKNNTISDKIITATPRFSRNSEKCQILLKVCFYWLMTYPYCLSWFASQKMETPKKYRHSFFSIEST